MNATTYAVGLGFFVAVWLGFLFAAPRSRPAILCSGLGWGHAGPITAPWFRDDYWRPDYLVTVHLNDWAFGPEDYVFAFLFAGLSAGLFDLLQRRWFARPGVRPTLRRFGLLLLLSGGYLLAMKLLIVALDVNSGYASMVTFVVGTAGALLYRPAWMLPASITALGCAGLMWLFYWAYFIVLFPDVIERWWLLDQLSGVRLAGVPLEEVLWAASAGLFAGPALYVTMGGHRK